ncbi:MAG: ribonuclease P protein component [Eubacteriales bacterium]|jgi:ribonuclease P protein component|nr:ribonuclease P protein component [Clostridiales bacterium]
MKYPAVCENKLFSAAYTKGKKHTGHYAVVYALHDRYPKNTAVSRLGLTVTKKRGGAVIRNRIKRVLREAYRAVDTKYGVKGGFIIIIVARDAAAKAKTPVVAADLAISLDALGLLLRSETLSSDADGRISENMHDKADEDAPFLKDGGITGTLGDNSSENTKGAEGTDDADVASSAMQQ